MDMVENVVKMSLDTSMGELHTGPKTTTWWGTVLALLQPPCGTPGYQAKKIVTAVAWCSTARLTSGRWGL